MLRLLLVAGSLLTVSGTGAISATATTTMAVTATVLSVCTVTAAPMAFGNYSQTVLDSTTVVAVICSSTTPFNVGLSAGTGTGATITNRRMTNGASTLQYTLTSDASHSTNIGQTVGTDTVAAVGNGLVQNFTIYGRIPAGQAVPAGVYTDTITATITY